MIKINFENYESKLQNYPIIVKIKKNIVTLKSQETYFNTTNIYSYPPLCNFISVQELKNIFLKLQREFLPQYESNTVNLAIFKYTNNQEYTKLIDYFQENCKIKHVNNNQILTLKEWFYTNLENINKLCSETVINYDNIRNVITNMYPDFYNEIDPLISIYVIKYFQLKTSIKKVLDINAERGSNMLGALVCNTDYIGIGLHKCYYKKYSTISSFYNSKNTVNFYNNISNIPKSCTNIDLMFTVFDNIDIDFSNNSKYESVELWIGNHIFKLLEKIVNFLRSGGIIAIYVKNPVNKYIDYASMILNFKHKNMDYIGDIIFKNGFLENKTLCWQKK